MGIREWNRVGGRSLERKKKILYFIKDKSTMTDTRRVVGSRKEKVRDLKQQILRVSCVCVFFFW